MPTMSSDPMYGVGWTTDDIHAAIDRLATGQPNVVQIREFRGMVDALIGQLEKRTAAVERAEARRLDAEERSAGRVVSINFDETSFDPHGHFVYLLWGEDPETPLYVGQSTNVLGRLGDHVRDNARRGRILRVQVLRCRNRSDMCKTEARLIAQYRPPLNVQLIGAAPCGDSAPILPHAEGVVSA